MISQVSSKILILDDRNIPSGYGFVALLCAIFFLHDHFFFGYRNFVANTRLTVLLGGCMYRYIHFLCV